MAGIKVPQYQIFKIGTRQLKSSGWDLHLSEQEAQNYNQLIALFEGQEFRIISKILNKPINKIDFKQYIVSILIEHPSHFERVVSENGIKINNIIYKRFLGTSGGLKCNTILLVNEDILDRLNECVECGRDLTKPIVPAKLEAYKALTCSASQPISDPKGILVVSDTITKVREKVIYLDDTDEEAESPEMKIIKDYLMENNATDGFNLCTPEYMKRISYDDLGLNYVTSGVCLRNAWLKGMLFAFPITEFIDTYNNGNYIVKDIWGNEKDLHDIEMIITESSLKLWDSYSSIEDYIEQYHKNGYEFAVTKIAPHKLDDVRELNYQYLQSYDFTDEDIKELTAPTVNYLKDALCGDYESTLKFLGIVNKVRSEDENTWQHALKLDSYMMGDPFIIDSVHKMIKKKIDQAKIGKLIVNGNYQICSGDPFIMMQHICGLPETGLLDAGEVYSEYWKNKGVKEIVIYRSPMTSHNNIRKCKVSDREDIAYWYRYYGTNMIINCHDTFCQAENGCDFDSDLLFSTDNEILIDRYVKLPAIICVQKNASKIIPTAQDMVKVEKNGMGNKVGSITNRVTSMMEKIAYFSSDTKEYEQLHYRIMCGQLYQQNEIDKLKGIISKPMPNNWYSYKGCDGDEFLKSICVENKPYFMTYIYDDYRRKYINYLKEANLTAKDTTGKNLDELLEIEKEKLTHLEKELIDNFYRWHPFGMGACAMNRICWYIEDQFNHITGKLKKQSNFDYHKLQYNTKIDNKLLSKYEELSNKYQTEYNKIKYKRESKNIDNEENIKQNIYNRNQLREKYKEAAKLICEDDKKRLDTIIELAYTNNCNRQFYWDCVGDILIKRLEEIKDEKNNL